MTENEIRRSVVAGSFYPAGRAVLQNMIMGYIDEAKDYNLQDINGLVSPHAGYIYSGQVAAYSYKQIAGEEYDSIFIIAPSHSEYFEFNSIFAGSAYETPLGLVKIDRDRCIKLGNTKKYSENIKISAYGHRSEHSLEVQLPFLQTVLKEFQIVPIVMGSQNRINIESLGNAIGELFGDERILIVASTDLSHYHSYDEASELDSQVENYIKNFNTPDFIDALTSKNLEMCGGGPVAATMIASKNLGATSSEILCYKNSGDVSGDRSAVVGYLSAAFYRK